MQGPKAREHMAEKPDNVRLETDIRLEDVEEALARIPSVTAVRVVSGTAGRVAEVHVLARRDRAPKQVVRDVQSVALATFGLEVDYRTVSVVQLDDPLTEAASVTMEAAARPSLIKITAEIAQHYTEIRVHVAASGTELVGSARGPASSGIALVARAVVDAVSTLVPDGGLDVDSAEVVAASHYSIALVVLRMASARNDLVVSGSAIVRRDANDAMARATLAALNRLLGPA